MTTGLLLVLTGGRGSGKTTLCRRLIERKTNEGWQVTGLLSPARFEGDKKTGIQAQAIQTGETYLLASQIPGEISGLKFGEWEFDSTVLAWGNQVLQRSTPTDLLIVDELGPLEFKLATGWMSAFDVLAHDLYRAALVVVRPECLDDARTRLVVAGIIDTSTDAGCLLEKILQRLQ